MVHAPREPYLASPDDPLQAGDGAVWMVPLTSLDPEPLMPAWRRVGRRLRYPGRPLHRPATLTVDWDAERFWLIVERDLAAMARPYLAFAIRTMSPGSVAPVDAVEAKVAALLRSPLVGRLVITTPEAVLGGGVVDASVANPDNLTRN